MKIACFLPDCSGGGGERAMLTLAGALAARGASVDLVVMRRAGSLAEAVPANVTVVDLGKSRMLYAVPALAAYWRRRRPGVLIATLWQANVAAALARLLAGGSTRLLLCIESPLDAGRRDLTPTRALRLAFRLLPRILRLADRVVAVSHGIARQLVSDFHIPAAQVTTIFNPVLTPQVAALAREPPPHPWLADPAVPVLVAAGRLHPCKDFETLLRAFARVRRARLVRLVLMGEGPERPRLEALMAELQIAADVALPGFVANPYAAYSRAAVFVSTSRYEGFGNALAEALACGAPVVSTDCPYGPAEILDGGRFGRLVPVGDVEALAAAIRACLDQRPPPADPAWLQHFHVDTVVARYLALMPEFAA